MTIRLVDSTDEMWRDRHHAQLLTPASFTFYDPDPVAVLSHPLRIQDCFRRCLVATILAASSAVSAQAADLSSPASDDGWHLRLENSTFLFTLEKQGLEDNTFTNSIGRDTTLIGDQVNITVRRRLSRSLEATVGAFANIPFGHEREVSRVLPILRLSFTPLDHVSFIAGTVRTPHRTFYDAVFDNVNRFVRPIEQGFQSLVATKHYRHDLFANWQQAFRGSAPNRYDVGYAGQVLLGPFRLNGQAHWIRNGQALLKFDRSFNTAHNVVTAFGPEVVLEPHRYFSSMDWWNEIGARFTVLHSYDEPSDFRQGTHVNGRGYEFQAWIDLDGWRPHVGFWRGRNFLSQQGDPEFVVGNFTEVGLSKIFSLGVDASIEIGTQARLLRSAVNLFVKQSREWVNQQYLVFNWTWDTSRVDLFGQLFHDGMESSAATSSPRRFRPMLDALTYIYHQEFSDLTTVGNRLVRDRTFAGQYLSPVLRYQATERLTLDAGLFVGLPVGSTQPFHTAQPILSAELRVWPHVSFVAGTIHRNHPFLDALFDDATLFLRPIEQGFQMLVDHPNYQQDLFINWNQEEAGLKPERFDLGYSGRVAYGPIGMNGQVYWVHEGGAQFSEFRSLQFGRPRNRATFNNFIAALGPDLTLRPADHWPHLSWLREIEIMALYLTEQNEPTFISESITRGRGYLLSAGIDLDGWRPYVQFWRGENFLTERGDPAYLAGNFTEFGLLKDFVLPAGFSLRVGGFGRMLGQRVTHTEYALLNWSWDHKTWRGFCLRPTLLHLTETPCGLP